MWTYKARVIRVIDGDTYEMFLDLGFHVHRVVRVRLKGVDTPELSTPEGKDARQYVEWHFARADEIVVRTLKFLPSRSFTRWVAEVYLDGRSLADILVSKGHVKK